MIPQFRHDRSGQELARRAPGKIDQPMQYTQVYRIARVPGDLKALVIISTIVFGVQGTPNCSTTRDEQKPQN